MIHRLKSWWAHLGYAKTIREDGWRAFGLRPFRGAPFLWFIIDGRNAHVQSDKHRASCAECASNPATKREDDMENKVIPSGKILVACATAAHEANRAYCLSIGDESQTHWDEAPEWQRESAIAGVHGVLVNGNGPKESHESWLAHKEKEGWKYGPTKDPEKKEHPCFVPYEELPEAQKAKDEIFITVVKVMAKALGFEGLS